MFIEVHLAGHPQGVGKRRGAHRRNLDVGTEVGRHHHGQRVCRRHIGLTGSGLGEGRRRGFGRRAGLGGILAAGKNQGGRQNGQGKSVGFHKWNPDHGAARRRSISMMATCSS